MKPRIKAIRAISAVYAKKTIQPIAFTVIGVLVGLITLVILLAIWLSNWILLLLVPLVPLFFIAVLMTAIVALAVKTIAPMMTSEQQATVSGFVDDATEVFESAKTPYQLILLKIARDIVLRRWDSNFIYNTVRKSSQLRPQFEAVVTSFS